MIPLIVIVDLHCDATMPSGAQEFGGGNTYARNLLLGLLDTNYDFLYITRKKYAFLEEKVLLSPRGTLYRIDLGDFGVDDKDKLQDHYEEAMSQIKRLLEQYPPTQYSFIFHSCYWQSGYLTRLLAAQYGTDYIHTVLSNGRSKAGRGATSDLVESRIATEDVVYRDAKYIICSSTSERQDLIELYNLPPDKLIVTGRWVDLRYRYPLYLDSGEIATNSLNGHAPTHYLPLYHEEPQKAYADTSGWWRRKAFLYLGRIHKNKGVPEIVAAWLSLYKKFGAKTPPLWLAGGSPPQIDDMRREIGDRLPDLYAAEEASKIVWWGTLDPAGVSTLLLKAMALIMHSKYEAGGIIVLEAMSQGVPVVATPFGYAKNYVEDWRNGFLVPYGDTQALQRRLEHFIHHPYLSNFLGARARADGERINASWDFIQNHLRLYGLAEPAGRPESTLSTQAFPPDTISVYPYCANTLAPAYLKELVKRWVHSPVVELAEEPVPPRGGYLCWRVTAGKDRLALFSYSDLFLWSPLWSRGEGLPLLTKYQRVGMAALLTETGCFPAVLGADQTQGLLLRRGQDAAVGPSPNWWTEKWDMLDRIFEYPFSEEQQSVPLAGLPVLTLRGGIAHLTQMADELHDWAPQVSRALLEAIGELEPAAIQEEAAGEVGFSVFGLDPVEVCHGAPLFIRSPQAIFLKSTWGAGHAAFLLEVHRKFPTKTEPELPALPAERAVLLQGWLYYFRAVETLLDTYGIPKDLFP